MVYAPYFTEITALFGQLIAELAIAQGSITIEVEIAKLILRPHIDAVCGVVVVGGIHDRAVIHLVHLPCIAVEDKQAGVVAKNHSLVVELSDAPRLGSSAKLIGGEVAHNGPLRPPIGGCEQHGNH